MPTSPVLIIATLSLLLGLSKTQYEFVMSSMPLAYGVCFWSAVTTLVAWTWVQKQGNSSAE